MAELLALEGVTAGYGDGVVLEDVSLALDEGDSLALLGRNGMGKTTLLVTLMGLTRLHRGSAALARRRSRGAADAPAQPVGAGLGAAGALHVPVAHGRGASDRRGAARALERRRASTRSFRGSRSGAATSATSSPAASSRCSRSRRALMVNPSLLLLDEPMEGLAPIIVQELMSVIRDLVADSGMAVIVVEQHAKLALSLTRQAIVLERGRVVHRSASEALLADPATLHRLVAVVVSRGRRSSSAT